LGVENVGFVVEERLHVGERLGTNQRGGSEEGLGVPIMNGLWSQRARLSGAKDPAQRPYPTRFFQFCSWAAASIQRTGNQGGLFG
jgi:hypothetical protein